MSVIGALQYSTLVWELRESSSDYPLNLAENTFIYIVIKRCTFTAVYEYFYNEPLLDKNFNFEFKLHVKWFSLSTKIKPISVQTQDLRNTGLIFVVLTAQRDDFL